MEETQKLSEQQEDRMRIEQVMSTQIYSCVVEDTLQSVAEAMWKHDVGCVPVVDRKDRVVGMVTDRDICMLAYRRDAKLTQLHVGEAMSQLLHSCNPGDTVHEVELLMSAIKVRRLPVVDGKGRLCGIVSLNDFARAAPRAKAAGGDSADEAKRVAATLAAVSAHCPNPGSSDSGG